MNYQIHQEVAFAVRPDQVYEVLTDDREFSRATGAAAKIGTLEGEAFSCFDGMIGGRQIELVPDQRIVQAWRARHWEPGVYSIVSFSLREDGYDTILVLDHTGFPIEEGPNLESGWTTMYWTPLRRFLS